MSWAASAAAGALGALGAYFLKRHKMFEDKKIQGRTRSCRSCSAPIIWLLTSTGKKMPADAATVEDDEFEFIPSRHTSHFATCPFANKHRKAR